MKGINKWAARAIDVGAVTSIIAAAMMPAVATAASVAAAMAATTGTTRIARAAMSVSLRIEEVCNIDSSSVRAAANAPQVQCQFNAPYTTELATADADATSTTTPAAMSSSVSPHAMMASTSTSNGAIGTQHPSVSTSATPSNSALSVWIVTF